MSPSTITMTTNNLNIEKKQQKVNKMSTITMCHFSFSVNDYYILFYFLLIFCSFCCIVSPCHNEFHCDFSLNLALLLNSYKVFFHHN